MDLFLERRRVVVTEYAAGMPGVTTVAGKLHRAQPGDLSSARRKNASFVPLKRPQRRADTVATWIKRRELEEVGLKRFVLMTEEPDRTLALVHSHPLVGALIDVLVGAGGREVR